MKRADNGIRPYGPGKFNTVLDSIIYDVTLDGCDDECGDVDEVGIWYGRLNGLVIKDRSTLLGLTVEEQAMIAQHSAGVIASEDSQGFVTVDLYRDPAALDAAWRRCRYHVARARHGVGDDDER